MGTRGNRTKRKRRDPDDIAYIQKLESERAEHLALIHALLAAHRNTERVRVVSVYPPEVYDKQVEVSQWAIEVLTIIHHIRAGVLAIYTAISVGGRGDPLKEILVFYRRGLLDALISLGEKLSPEYYPPSPVLEYAEDLTAEVKIWAIAIEKHLNGSNLKDLVELAHERGTKALQDIISPLLISLKAAGRNTNSVDVALAHKALSYRKRGLTWQQTYNEMLADLERGEAWGTLSQMNKEILEKLRTGGNDNKPYKVDSLKQLCRRHAAKLEGKT